VQTLMPSVVNVTSRSLVAPPTSALNAATTPGPNSGMTPEERAKTELGSGFVIDPDGYIVTNNHVIDGAFDVSVTFQDGTQAHAEVLATTKIGDIALLKVNVNRKLQALKFADSTKLRVGDPVIAIGNPLGFGGSVSTGIVSALNRDVMLSPFDDFIQTDAALNHGNSGGPLFNLQGEVIGVNTALYNPTGGGSIGIGLAIPAYCVQFVVGQLRQYGVVRAGELGLHVQNVTADIAFATGLPQAEHTSSTLGGTGLGVIVSQVVLDGPADAAGVQEGDILLSVNDQPIGDIRGYARLIAVGPIGSQAHVKLWRQGKILEVAPVVREWLTAEQTDRAALARSTSPRRMTMDLGLQLVSLTPDERTARNLPEEVQGVLVTDVRPNSVAGDRGLQEGDVIVKVMNKPVRTPDEVFSSVKGMADQKDQMILLLVRNDKDLRWVAMPIDPALVVSTKN
jgi:serine protease Do